MSKSILKTIDAGSTGKFKHKDDAAKALESLSQELYDKLYLMFAHDKHSLLIILQGIDTSGKDGTIRHLFSSANPQGLTVHSFKEPNEEELRHDFLWRCHRWTPAAGRTAIFNRSYYEDVTTTMVHPDLLEKQHLPEDILARDDLIERRYKRINEFEKMLCQNGTTVLKFFLHISKDEQKKRLEERLTDKSKNWKFSEKDIAERRYWDDYMVAFDKMLHATHTKHAPWYVIPADHKWFRNYMVTQITVETLKRLKMKFPKIENAPQKIK